MTCIDHSASNPGLHRLHVTYAQDELAVYERMIRELEDFSRVNPSIMASIIHKERAELIKNNAAYREAAWRLLCGDLIVPEPRDHRVERAFNPCGNGPDGWCLTNCIPFGRCGRPVFKQPPEEMGIEGAV